MEVLALAALSQALLEASVKQGSEGGGALRGSEQGAVSWLGVNGIIQAAAWE